ETPGTEDGFRRRAADLYAAYSGRFKSQFKWLPTVRFLGELARDLKADADSLLDVLDQCGEWDPRRDAKLDRMTDLLTRRHPQEKVIVFSQFADTVAYLAEQLRRRTVTPLAAVTGDTDNPTAIVWRFSPQSNAKHAAVSAGQEIRVLIATDVLSEGQNLQD